MALKVQVQQQESPKASWSRQYPLSNHLWVNTERMKASLEPLSRSTSLDEMARDHADEMAEACEVFRCTHEGAQIIENSTSGPSIQTIHKLTMSFDGRAKDNILNPKWKEFGMGAARGSDNSIYICQLFC